MVREGREVGGLHRDKEDSGLPRGPPKEDQGLRR